MIPRPVDSPVLWGEARGVPPGEPYPEEELPLSERDASEGIARAEDTFDDICKERMGAVCTSSLT